MCEISAFNQNVKMIEHLQVTIDELPENNRMAYATLRNSPEKPYIAIDSHFSFRSLAGTFIVICVNISSKRLRTDKDIQSAFCIEEADAKKFPKKGNLILFLRIMTAVSAVPLKTLFKYKPDSKRFPDIHDKAYSSKDLVRNISADIKIGKCCKKTFDSYPFCYVFHGKTSSMIYRQSLPSDDIFFGKRMSTILNLFDKK